MIFDQGTEDAILNFSHMRSNVLSPLNIGDQDRILILEPDSDALVEWLEEKAAVVTVAGPDGLDAVKDSYNIILSLGHLIETPASLKTKLMDQGKLVYALSEKDKLAGFTKKLLKEAGFEDITTYRVSPDYLFTTEIYAEDYIGGGAGDYLLIAK